MLALVTTKSPLWNLATTLQAPTPKARRMRRSTCGMHVRDVLGRGHPVLALSLSIFLSLIHLSIELSCSTYSISIYIYFDYVFKVVLLIWRHIDGPYAMFPFSSVYRCILGIFYLCLYVHLYFKHFTLITQNKSDKTKLSHKHLNKIDKPTAHRYGHEHGVYHAFPPGPP